MSSALLYLSGLAHRIGVFFDILFFCVFFISTALQSNAVVTANIMIAAKTEK